MKVYLDDERPTPKGWWRLYTASETIRFLEAHHVEAISLDHDLGEGNGTGYDVAKWIEEQTHINPNYLPPAMFCHSANPPGKTAIESCIKWIETRLRSKITERELGYLADPPVADPPAAEPPSPPPPPETSSETPST